jgi:hypothetical protein
MHVEPVLSPVRLVAHGSVATGVAKKMLCAAARDRRSSCLLVGDGANATDRVCKSRTSLLETLAIPMERMTP